jgi:proteasome lid subunit RPN8/RPN11
MESVDIASSVLDAMTAHARAELPNECCGLLVGSIGRVDESVPTRNLAASPTRFEINPREHFELIRRLRAAGDTQQIVGAYHSHPSTPAVPSPTDLAEAYYPEFVYVIVSLIDPARADVRAYRVRDAQAMAIAVRRF